MTGRIARFAGFILRIATLCFVTLQIPVAMAAAQSPEPGTDLATASLQVADSTGAKRPVGFVVLDSDGKKVAESKSGEPVALEPGAYLLEATNDDSLASDIELKAGETRVAQVDAANSVWLALKVDAKQAPRHVLVNCVTARQCAVFCSPEDTNSTTTRCGRFRARKPRPMPCRKPYALPAPGSTLSHSKWETPAESFGPTASPFGPRRAASWRPQEVRRTPGCCCKSI